MLAEMELITLNSILNIVMTYFKEDFNEFFKDLAANNNRDWFNDNKKRYEKAVKKPFEAFVAAMITAMTDEEPDMVKLQPKDAIFRIHRDTRFAKDKTPYKMHVSAVLSPLGRKDMELPGTYIQLGVGEVWIGGGAYAPSKEQIEMIRTAMIQSPETVEELSNDAIFKQFFAEIKGEKNKRLLKPFSEWTERLPLVANKQFYYMAEYRDDESLVLRSDLVAYVLSHIRAARGWQDFLRAAISMEH